MFNDTLTWDGLPTYGSALSAASSQATRDTIANTLQLAIWESLGYARNTDGSNDWDDNGTPAIRASFYDDYSTTLNDQTWVADYNDAVSNNDWSGIGDVRILNVVTANGGAAQDQLIIVPPQPTHQGSVPEPISIVVWSCLAVCLSSARCCRKHSC